MRATSVLVGVGLVLGGGPLAGQFPIKVTIGGSAESYAFDPGFGPEPGQVEYTQVTQIAAPLGVSVPLGRHGDLTISTGFVRVWLNSRFPQELENQDLTGALDTEMRLSWNVIPNRVIVFANGVIPTGTATVEEGQLNILGVSASDVIGFRIPTVGTGGGGGGGFGAAVPISGSWSAGIGGSVRVPLAYQPLTDATDKIKPGTDLRLRAGIEGSIARRTYLRIAGVFARQGDYVVADTGRSRVGNRIMGHLSLNQGLGNGALTVYAFDVFRGTPELVGATVLPRGNLFGAGARYELALGSRFLVVPRGEFRVSEQAAIDDDAMRKAGQSWRLGADLQYSLSGPLRVILQGDGVIGSLRPITGAEPSGELPGFSGWRAGLFLEWRP
jgi:hypothetical protein